MKELLTHRHYFGCPVGVGDGAGDGLDGGLGDGVAALGAATGAGAPLTSEPGPR